MVALPPTVGNSYNKPYRKYRSECVILNDMLKLVAKNGREGIKKTPLMNYMNMNNTSFKTYKGMLEDAALIEKKDHGRSEVLYITGAGRLLLEFMKAFSCLYNYERWRARQLAEAYARRLAEEHGWVIRKDDGLVDYLLEGSGRKVGVLGAVCEGGEAALLARLVKDVTELNDIVIVRLSGSPIAENAPRFSLIDDGIVIVNASSDGVNKDEVIRQLAEILAGRQL